MVRLNKTLLESEQVKKLLHQLAKVVNPSNPNHSNLVLAEILGQEEQIMFAKRLAAIVLLAEGFTSYKISRTLKLSESTVASISHRMGRGEYEVILHTLGSDKKNYFTILEAIDNILHLGGALPHYNGLDRYKGL